MEAWPPRMTALVVDDLHTIEGSAGEAALGRLIDYLPSGVHLIISTRRPPSWNLSRWRVSGQLAEVGREELRFRASEADVLFRDHYQAPIPPDQLRELLRRTDGWAAGLRLFRLATEGGGDEQRRVTLNMLSSRLPSAREYIDDNVLESLDSQLRQFLIRTSVLGRLSPQWCDELLQHGGSNRILDEAMQRHGLLTVDQSGRQLHYSEAVRARLEELLIDEIGESGSRQLHRRAGRILEAGRALPEALRAYCRAEDWDAVTSLMGRAGEHALAGWTGPIPPAVPEGEAWRLLAKARGHLFAGHWQDAAGLYRRVSETNGDSAPADTCRRELAAIACWNDPGAPPPADWAGLLRDGLRRGNAVLTPAHDSGPALDFAMGLSLIAAGDFGRGGKLVQTVACADVSRPMAAYAHLASAAAQALDGRLTSGRSTGCR